MPGIVNHYLIIFGSKSYIGCAQKCRYNILDVFQSYEMRLRINKTAMRMRELRVYVTMFR